ncbi:hypothetical protein C8F04DRAFT_1241391 [Mycena alexandri]|uniref:Uncharacterized protein n=1 Tax=Mycena alexandri TaxID=1745969 RepID=A0AAD6WS01_9AGAR|nr:hypothetical protein C8F04DRAFT_1241391 [Mycena alexandri]
MPNPRGKNGYGNAESPQDAELEAKLRHYAAQNLPQEVRIANLKSDLNYSIRPPVLEVSRQAVIYKVRTDVSQGNGLNYFKTLLQQEGLMIPRDTVRTIRLEHFPLGFDNCFPGKKKSAIPRTPLNSNGPFHEVSSDGHEKLGKQALDMGDIGLPIYGYKDKWSDSIPFIQFVPDSLTAAAIGHLYLEFIETTGGQLQLLVQLSHSHIPPGIPIQTTMDMGSEIGWQYAIQDALRHTFAPEIDQEVYPVCRLIKSVHNPIIEAFWRWFKEKMGLNLKAVILVGKAHLTIRQLDHYFYWIFVPLLQAELEEFRIWWNHHRVRPQKEKNMPSGHVPADAFDHPQNFGGLDCLIEVPQTAVDDLRSMMTEEVGPKDAHLSWFTADFDELAENIYEQIGKPPSTLETAWGVCHESRFSQPIHFLPYYPVFHTTTKLQRNIPEYSWIHTATEPEYSLKRRYTLAWQQRSVFSPLGNDSQYTIVHPLIGNPTCGLSGRVLYRLRVFSGSTSSGHTPDVAPYCGYPTISPPRRSPRVLAGLFVQRSRPGYFHIDIPSGRPRAVADSVFEKMVRPMAGVIEL